LVPKEKNSAAWAISPAGSAARGTVRPNIWISRRYESQANRSFPLCAASPCTLESLRPMSRMVSIIPGMEDFPPERTDTSSGSRGSPSRLPSCDCTRRRCASTSSSSPSGTDPLRRYARHASVVMVNPGGTGRPIRVISARFASCP
jgi:hypothetical protein